MSRRRPSAVYLPSVTLSSPEPRLMPSGVVCAVIAPAMRPERPKVSISTRSPSARRMLLVTWKLSFGSAIGAPTMRSSDEAHHGAGEIGGRDPRVGHGHGAGGLELTTVDAELEVWRGGYARLRHVDHQ